MTLYSINTGDHIAHHGRQGQKWGVRNGPPYPLYRQKSIPVQYKRKVNYGGKYSDKRQQKIYRKELEKRDELFKDVVPGQELSGEARKIKESMMARPKASEILRYQNIFTNSELESLTKRLISTKAIDDFSSKEVHDWMKKVDSVISKVDKANKWVSTGFKAAENLDKIQKLLEGKEEILKDKKKKE